MGSMAGQRGDECRHLTPWPTDTFCQGVCSIRRLEWLELGEEVAVHNAIVKRTVLGRESY